MNDAKGLFLSLTPHKVIEAVEDAGLLSNRVAFARNSFENRVYEIELEDRTRVIAKFYRPGRWSRAQILEEHRFLAELVEAEIPVCAPLAFPDGSTLRALATDDASGECIEYTIFPRTGGRAPDELSHPLAERLGRLAARLHNVGAARPAEHRLELSAKTFVRDNLAFLTGQGALPERALPRYLAAAEQIAEAVDERMLGVERIRLHGDLHAGNLLERDGLLHVLDFDDMMTGPPVQDAWLLFSGRDQETLALRDTFLDAYEELRSFDHASLRLVEPLRGLRMIHYAAWIAKRWHDPIFPRTFPHFGSPAYWEEQTRDLEDALELVAGSSSAGAYGR